MNKVRLGDVCEAIIDCPHTTPKWRSDGIPIIRNFNLEDNVISLRDPSFVDEETYESRTRRAMPEEGDIVISREAPMGRVGLVPKDLKCCLGQRLVLLKPKHDAITSRYLLIALTSNFVQTQIRRADAAGSIVSNLTLPQIRDLIIPISDDADAIASLLGAIDDKIALNKKLCAELEETAQLIYDYWFTQFDFPDENGNPYRSSGGKMVSDETLKREIPEGWKAVKVLDLVTIEKGISYTSQDLLGTGIPMLNLASFDESGSYKAAGLKTYSGTLKSGRYIEPFDLLMCTTQQTAIDRTGKTNVIGKAILSPDIFDGEATFSTDLAKLAPEREGHHYILAALFKRQDIHKHIIGFANGTKIKHLDIAGALNFHVPLPPDQSSLFDAYSTLAKKTVTQTSELMKQCQRLESLRNWLLPMLMNGQVKLGNAPEDVTEVHV